MRPTITVAISLLLAFFSATLTYSAPIPLRGKFSSAAMFLQITPTPQQNDVSEIGSTDGIVILGGVIAFIIVLPILLRRKSWTQD